MFAAVQRARELPGVRGAALATMVPYGNLTNAKRVMPASEATAAQADPSGAKQGQNGLYASVTPGYFDTIGVRLLRGRDFTQAEAENKETPKVAIVDETMAKKLFPDTGRARPAHQRHERADDGRSARWRSSAIVSAHRHEFIGDEINAEAALRSARAAYNGAVLPAHVRTASTQTRRRGTG
jgi:hypothetical protein